MERSEITKRRHKRTMKKKVVEGKDFGVREVVEGGWRGLD
jgi:hypothetical protein